MKILITGGLGFIGKNLIVSLNRKPNVTVLNLDAHTSAVEDAFHYELMDKKRFRNEIGNICDEAFVRKAFFSFKPNLLLNLAAESHVDNSIMEPTKTVHENVVGVANLLKVAHEYMASSTAEMDFRFFQFSTDEVYGDLGNNTENFNEYSEINPSSPYSASKASGDLLVRAWHRTYGIPYIITRCSNNYGPFQGLEKFIPKLIACLLKKEKFGLYGSGLQERDWLFVEDCVVGIEKLIFSNIVNDTFNIGTGKRISNIEVINFVIDDLASKIQVDHSVLRNFITPIKDRPGHDQRYCINAEKFISKTNWHPVNDFKIGINKTVNWYLKQGKLG